MISYSPHQTPRPAQWCWKEEFEAPCTQPEAQVESWEDFFIWIRRNPLKSPDSTKGIQGNPSFFAWISLDSLAFI
jgi:hypothetical protein